METYEEIYQRMKNRYCEERGGDFDEASDIAIRLRVLAGEIYNSQTSLEWLKRQLSPLTATGERLDLFAEQRGLERRPAAKARGSIVFGVEETRESAIVIPRGTVVSTDTESPVRVYTTEDSELPPNTYSVAVAAEAEQAGYRGNIRVRTAVVPVSVPSEIDSVTNLSAFQGGADEESDVSLRERIRESYVNCPNGMNAAYYIGLATSVDGIAKAGVIKRLRGAGTLNVYVSGADGTVSDAKLAEVQELIASERELNVDVLVARASGVNYDLDVTVRAKPGYGSAEVTQKCTAAFEEYIETIPMGGKLYLSTLGKYMLETGCIENYQYGVDMSDATASGANFFVAGDVNIGVII